MVLAAIEVVVQAVDSAVLEADSVEVLEVEDSPADGNHCKAPAGSFQFQTLPVKCGKRFVCFKFRYKGKQPGMLVYFKLSP